MRIDPKLVIDFATIAQEGSFTRAAERLRVAQPWLSARLAKLEGILGVRLLERTTRKVVLTEHGVEFLEVARSIVEACAAADRLGLQLKRRTSGVLRIGAAPYTKMIRKRHELIDAFAAARPDIRIELETGWSLALLSRLEAGEIDVTFMMGDVDPEHFEAIPLHHYGLGTTMARTHSLASMTALTPDRLKGRSIGVYTRSLAPKIWDRLYAPLINAGVNLVEMPVLAEGPPHQMSDPEAIAAFFDFGSDEGIPPTMVRIPVTTDVNIPFQLLRLRASPSATIESLWNLVRQAQPGGD